MTQMNSTNTNMGILLRKLQKQSSTTQRAVDTLDVFTGTFLPRTI